MTLGLNKRLVDQLFPYVFSKFTIVSLTSKINKPVKFYYHRETKIS